MLSVKWKVYKILNYVLIVFATILFLLMLTIIMDNSDDISAYLVACIFLFMIFQALINLYILSKNFPYHILSGPKLTRHVIAVALDIISFLGMLAFLIFVIKKTLGRRDQFDNVGTIVFIVCSCIWVLNGFILFCQLTVTSYLRKNSKTLFHTMIDSIGENN